MKVEQKQATFQPVTITLETLQEVKAMAELMCAMTSDAYEAVQCNMSATYSRLFYILEQQGEKPEFKLKPILPDE